jgi:hypothetical protein
MRIGWAAVFAPVVGALLIGLVSVVLDIEFFHPLLVIWSLIFGLPVAIVYSVLTSYFLGEKLLLEDSRSYLNCASWGTGIAAITAALIVGNDPMFFVLTAWGFLSGLLFRYMSGTWVG